MIELTLVDAFREVFKVRPVDVRSDDCLNLRHKHAGCRLCEEACPSAAITLSNGQPHLQARQCVNCGACLRVCPTDVFLLMSTPESELLSIHVDLPLHPLGLICSVHQSPDISHMPVQKVLRHQRCLAGFSTICLMELAADGDRPVWLDDSYCDRCPIGHAHKTIAQAVEAANLLLFGFRRTTSIYLQQEEKDTLASEPHTVRIVENGRPEVSRRGFFKMLGGRVQQQAADVIEYLPDSKQSGPVPVAERLPHRVPTSRRRLNARLANLFQTDAVPANDDVILATHIPYADVAINDVVCTACELCARFCPTASLRFATGGDGEDDSQTFALSFRANLCLDCHICVVVCPEDALNMAETVRVATLVENNWKDRAKGRLAECAQCQTPTRIKPEAEVVVCSTCRHDNGGGIYRPGSQADLISDLFDRMDED